MQAFQQSSTDGKCLALILTEDPESNERREGTCVGTQRVHSGAGTVPSSRSRPSSRFKAFVLVVVFHCDLGCSHDSFSYN